MNEYTFNWTLTPALEVEYAVAVSPFTVIANNRTVTLTTKADAVDESALIEQSGAVARNVARSLSYALQKRFEVSYGGYSVRQPGGGIAICPATAAATATASGSADYEMRDLAGNVVDSSAMQRDRERQATEQRVSDLARRAARDVNLRDMLDHWERYVADPEGRLHPLYDILQVAETLHAGKNARGKAAVALNMVEKDLDELGRISNDPTVLNGRHPGKSLGPHRIATEAEVATCERVARAMIENYAAKIVVYQSAT
jgi:hypothetical protein